MPFDQNAEQIFAKVFGRAPQSVAERSFVTSAAQRKTGGALQGAFESAQNRGQFSGATSTSAKDPMDEAITGIEQAARQVDEVAKKQFTTDLQLKLKQTLLGTPEIKKLLELEGQSEKKVQEFKPGVQGSELALPTQLGALQGQALSGDIGTAGDIGRAFATRGQGISDIISDITEGQKQQLESAQTGLTAKRSALSDLLSVQGEKRERELFPLKLKAEQLGLTKLQAEIENTRADTAKKLSDGGTDVVPGDPSSLSAVTQSILNSPELYKTITPTQRAQVLKEMTAYGADPETIQTLTVEFDDKLKADITGYENLSAKVGQAITGLNSGTFKTGPLQSRLNEARATTPFGAPIGWNEYSALANITSAQKMKELSGVQFSEKEYDRLKAFLPRATDQEAKALSKLNLFLQETERIKQERINNQFKNVLDFKQDATSGLPTVGDTFRGEKVTNVKEIK